jgi:2-polyprenyl-3-methyl-5-hydroxy-6-metoxy-1,4-benzoquinol methylase
MASTNAVPAGTPRTPEAFVRRLRTATAGMFDVISVHIGDRLGLYRALRDGGPATAPELATRAGIDGRYAREWLEQQAATDILDVEDVSAGPDERRFSLPDAHAEALLDPESPYSIAPLGRGVVASTLVLPQLLDAFRTGGGVSWAAYGADGIESQGDGNRPWLVNSFATENLPAIADVHERLTTDPPARVAEVACGVGWAGIGIARAYPKVRVDGFDLDETSIALAERNAREAGVADRVSFAVRDAADPAAIGGYDLVVIIEAVHDMSRPVEALSAVRRMLLADGIALIVDEKNEDAFTAPAPEGERIHYGFSLLNCLPTAMTDRPTAATGAVIRAETMHRYANDAGFRTVERLDEPKLETLCFYRLRP